LDFDLRSVVEDVTDILALKALEKNLELAALIPADLPWALRGDPGRLRQVLLNLVGNALKFTERGEVALEVQLEKDSAARVELRIRVRDTGLGIPGHRIEGLFQPFVQVDTSASRKFGGTGLGLAISRRLVELLGGRIGVESELGRGSTFWFTCAFEKQTAPAPEPGFVPVNLEQKRILIVDDNATNRRVAREQLRPAGCICEDAADGEAALEALDRAFQEGRPFHLAILDMNMPGMDGIELARRVKASADLRSVVLLLLSSRGMKDDASKARDAGFAACVTKPLKRQILQRCVSVALGSKRFLAEAEIVPAAERLESEARLREGSRILVAEDNPTNQKVALMILKRLGFRAEAVSSGVEAIHALESMPFDLVLMDVQMPELDGFSATRIIRESEAGHGRRIPIIAMTAHAMRGDREMCLEAGMDDYIAKPVQPAELARVIDRVLAARRVEAPTSGG
jgi:CheY-like chemotaxis protein